MDKQQIAQQALSNARNGESLANYATIFQGFGEKGIAQSDIQPRVNVFTFHAWKALGRQVRKGEHGVKVCTYVPMDKVVEDNGERKVEAWKAPRMTTVFHISQTDAIDGAKHEPVAAPAERQPVAKQDKPVGFDYYSDEFTPIS